MTRNAIYLDNNATTALAPEVLDAMLPYLEHLSGNASSQHALGRHARRAIDLSRRQIADAVNADPKRILFVSGATEANNLAIFGARIPPGSRIVVNPSEHPSVLEPLEQLKRRGHAVLGIPLDAQGKVKEILAPEMDGIALALVQLANGETGCVQNISLLAQSLPPGCLFHCDAVQAMGKMPLDFSALGVSSMCISGHKVHGPQGIGALIHREEKPFHPLFFGGHQQSGMRPGTEPIAAIVGLGKAVELANLGLRENIAHMKSLRDALERGILANLEDVVVNGAADDRLPNTTNLSFLGTRGEALVMALDLAGVCCSAGTACASGSMEPSAVLKAMGIFGDRLESAVRFSVCMYTRADEIEEAIRRIVEVVPRVRRSVQRV